MPLAADVDPAHVSPELDRTWTRGPSLPQRARGQVGYTLASDSGSTSKVHGQARCAWSVGPESLLDERVRPLTCRRLFLQDERQAADDGRRNKIRRRPPQQLDIALCDAMMIAVRSAQWFHEPDRSVL